MLEYCMVLILSWELGNLIAGPCGALRQWWGQVEGWVQRGAARWGIEADEVGGALWSFKQWVISTWGKWPCVCCHFLFPHTGSTPGEWPVVHCQSGVDECQVIVDDVVDFLPSLTPFFPRSREPPTTPLQCMSDLLLLFLMVKSSSWMHLEFSQGFLGHWAYILFAVCGECFFKDFLICHVIINNRLITRSYETLREAHSSLAIMRAAFSYSDEAMV